MTLPINQIICGDCLTVLKTLPDESIDAIVTDPPYELGFMGKHWDASGIAYNVELWSECLRVLKPGAHLLAFGGTRTYHRMACAIEDAGFEVRDMLEWIYASGFPKSLNIGKAVDKLQGNEREVVGEDKNWGQMSESAKFTGGQEWNITKGNSEWEGFGTALKPAHEPICLARKPLSEPTIVENVLKHGTGGLDIDGCRIPTSEQDIEILEAKASKEFTGVKPFGANEGKGSALKPNTQGRFPANIICTDDALNDGVMTKSVASGYNWEESNNDNPTHIAKNIKSGVHFGDSGSKSRYFDIDVWAEKYGLIQFPKASKSERNKNLSGYILKSNVSDKIVKEIKNLLSI